MIIDDLYKLKKDLEAKIKLTPLVKLKDVYLKMLINLNK